MLTNISRSATSLSTSAEAVLQRDKNDLGLYKYLPYIVITAFVCVCVCVCVVCGCVCVVCVWCVCVCVW